MLVTKAEFARISGVSRQAVHKALKSGDLFHAEVDGKLDTDHPAARKWLLDHDVDPTEVRLGIHKPREKATGARPLSADPAELPDISELIDWTLRRITDTFGWAEQFGDWLSRRKTIAEVRRLELQNAESERRLIPRQAVETFVMAFIDATNRRLLRDFPKNVVSQIYALAKSGAPLEEAEGRVKDALASHLAPLKTKAAKALRDA